MVYFLKKLMLLIFAMLAGMIIPVSAWGVSGLGCIGVTVAEYLIPGLGYGILGHYDKMLVLGGSRWMVLNKYWQYSSSSDYEQYYNKIYKKKKLCRTTLESVHRTQPNQHASKQSFHLHSEQI